MIYEDNKAWQKCPCFSHLITLFPGELLKFRAYIERVLLMDEQCQSEFICDWPVTLWPSLSPLKSILTGCLYSLLCILFMYLLDYLLLYCLSSSYAIFVLILEIPSTNTDGVESSCERENFVLEWLLRKWLAGMISPWNNWVWLVNRAD